MALKIVVHSSPNGSRVSARNRFDQAGSAGDVGRLAQLVERQLDMLEVGGSRPSPPTNSSPRGSPKRIVRTNRAGVRSKPQIGRTIRVGRRCRGAFYRALD